MLENHFANGLSLERGFQAFHGSEGSFETRLDPCIEAKPMDNPALSLLLVQQSTQRKREIPCGVSSGESTRPCTHRRLSNEGEREGVRERERGHRCILDDSPSPSFSFNIGQGFYRLSRMEFL